MSMCPKCDMPITGFKLVPMKAYEEVDAPAVDCVAICCPRCDTVVSVQVMPGPAQQ